jgi:hypothetical protein
LGGPVVAAAGNRFRIDLRFNSGFVQPGQLKQVSNIEVGVEEARLTMSRLFFV